MTVYQLTGIHFEGGEDWPYSPIFATLEAAENHKQKEIDAYTKVKGVVMFKCPYDFQITQKEVQG